MVLIARAAARIPELEPREAAREVFVAGGAAIRVLAFDPLLPAPIVDPSARWALVDEMAGVRRRELVAQCALDLLARDGIPPPPESLGEEERAGFERVWIDLLIQVLQNDFGGMLSASACRALARISGRPLTVRPETWIDWWHETGRPPARVPESRAE